MLGKSLVAGTVLTLLAGGAVYYGTDVNAAASLKSGAEKLEKMVKSKDGSRAEASSHDTSKDTSKDTASYKIEDSKSASDMSSLKTGNDKLIHPKGEKTVEAPAAAPEEAKAKNPSSDRTGESEEKPTRKWIDQYLKPDSTSAPAITATTTRESEDIVLEAAEEEAEIAAILAQEDALEKELADMMAEMDDTEMLETLEVEETKETDSEQLTEEKILKAETKGFEDRAKHIENIWESKDTPTATENEVIDLGNSKITILRAENVEGHAESKSRSSENGKQEAKIKVTSDKVINGEVIADCTEEQLMQNVYDMRKKKNPRRHLNHDKRAHPKMAHSKEKCADAPKKSNKTDVSEADVSETVKIIMTQAEKISMPELRDRAYLDLVSYALSTGDTASANIAMSKIEQVELRDTARNRMAVDYAKNGNAEKAFAILENIEVDALRDVMRLQVIEALIAPETQAPKGMQ